MSMPSDSSENLSEHDMDDFETLSSRVLHIKKKIQAKRLASIREKLEKNAEEIKANKLELLSLAKSCDLDSTEPSEMENKLLSRMRNPRCMLYGHAQGSGGRYNFHYLEDFTTTNIQLPYIEKLPPYISWAFVAKNQKILDEQLMLAMKDIYCEQFGKEGGPTIDENVEETEEPKEKKPKFSKGEDRILLKISEEYELNEEVLTVLSEVIKATSAEIQERYKTLLTEYEKQVQGSNEKVSKIGTYMDDNLKEALDSFDHIFCRRCLDFDCRLHGCSQSVLTPVEKKPYVPDPKEKMEPCGNQCYLQASQDANTNAICKKIIAEIGIPVRRGIVGKRTAANISKTSGSGALTTEQPSLQLSLQDAGERSVSRERGNVTSGKSKLSSKKLNRKTSKKLKKSSGRDEVYVTSENQPSPEPIRRRIVVSSEDDNDSVYEANNNKHVALSKQSISIGQVNGALSSSEWNRLEKDLYFKGIEIFGKNSCLISRNLLPGFKTCKEVFMFMLEDEAAKKSSVLPDSYVENDGKSDTENKEKEKATRSQITRRRGRTRRLKFTWRSTGNHTSKRMGNGKLEKHYTPCECKSMCTTECSCHKKGTCCEKYCGCSKSCRFRFRGCHCAKSQCQSEQCACFAAKRECDPDVCRNCSLSCGDGSLGEPPVKKDANQCQNMKILLKQNKKILLAKSDLIGWGVFIQDSVNKGDFIGEYTGEVIDQDEADIRGHFYDRVDSSFLFNLNDESVVDAFRKGNKLKFANHSSTPNCEAKVLLVAGDHRIGIFAQKRIESGEELFYDYCYGPNAAGWSQTPDGTSKKDNKPVKRARSKKRRPRRRPSKPSKPVAGADSST